MIGATLYNLTAAEYDAQRDKAAWAVHELYGPHVYKKPPGETLRAFLRRTHDDNLAELKQLDDARGTRSGHGK